MWFWLIIAIILAPGVLVSLLLAIPVDAGLDLDVHGKPVLNAKVTWLFGLVTLRPGGAKAALKREKPPKSHKERVRKAGFAGFREVWELIRTEGLLNEVKKLIIRLVRCFKMKELEGEFRVGLPDPAYTGMLYGLFMAATAPFGWPLMREVHVYPVFDNSVFEGNLHGVIRLRPISLLGPPFLFIFSGPVMTVLRMLVVNRWRTKKLRQSERSPSAA